MMGEMIFFFFCALTFVSLLVLGGIAKTTILCDNAWCYFSIRIHFGQITSNQMLVPVIEKLKETTISKVSQVRVSIFVEVAIEEEGEVLVSV